MRKQGVERKLVLECDSIAKEARAKCSDNEVIDEVKNRGNVSLKHKQKHYDKKISEVIKKIDSEKCMTEYFQDKYGENWHLIDIEAREAFANSTVNQIKCAAGLKMSIVRNA